MERTTAAGGRSNIYYCALAGGCYNFQVRVIRQPGRQADWELEEILQWRRFLASYKYKLGLTASIVVRLIGSWRKYPNNADSWQRARKVALKLYAHSVHYARKLVQIRRLLEHSPHFRTNQERSAGLSARKPPDPH